MFYCGLDVAMKSSYVYITDSQGRKRSSGELATTKAGLTQRLRPYLRRGRVAHPSRSEGSGRDFLPERPSSR
jgi:hypothetical protein